jgi:hypothetical protein
MARSLDGPDLALSVYLDENAVPNCRDTENAAADFRDGVVLDILPTYRRIDVDCSTTNSTLNPAVI